MNQNEAIALVRGAVREPGGVWADLGAGAGTFTRALASLLGPSGTVYAIDRDESALRELERQAGRGVPRAAAIRTVRGDFTQPLALPSLDGVVLANALHFVPYREQAAVLERVAGLVSADGAIVIIEYDRPRANRWVPFPISPAALADLARRAGLGAPEPLATRPSAYSGTIYSVLVRLDARELRD